MTRDGETFGYEPALPVTTATPTAVLGNGDALVSIDGRGVIVSFAWPTLDSPSWLRFARIRLLLEDGPVWLDDAWSSVEQSMSGRTVTTRGVLGDGRVLAIRDCLDPDGPTLLRELTGEVPRHEFVVRPTPGGSEDRCGAVATDAGVEVYRGGARMRLRAEASDGGWVQELRPPSSENPSPNASTAPEPVGIGLIAVGVRATRGAYLLSLGEELDTPTTEPEAVRARRRDADHRCIAPLRDAELAPADRSLVDTALLTLDSLTGTSGAVLAGPDVDRAGRWSDGYGLVWPRDLAMVGFAYHAWQLDDRALRLARWLVSVQRPDGLWDQRNWTTGEVGPSLGIQLDETGLSLQFLCAAAQRSPGHLAELWPPIQAAAEALRRVFPADGRMTWSIDVWEERLGVHAFTLGTCAKAMSEAASVGLEAGRLEASGDWQVAADRMTEILATQFWSPDDARFVRSRWVARRDRGGQPIPEWLMPSRGFPGSRTVRSVDDTDAAVDASLVWLGPPFGPLAADDPRYVSTVAAVIDALSDVNGGIGRYEGDRYLGGNSWPLLTVWTALAAVVTDLDAARGERALAWVARSQAPTGCLSEQVRTDTWDPIWVTPLAWSHAAVLHAIALERGNGRR